MLPSEAEKVIAAKDAEIAALHRQLASLMPLDHQALSSSSNRSSSSSARSSLRSSLSSMGSSANSSASSTHSSLKSSLAMLHADDAVAASPKRSHAANFGLMWAWFVVALMCFVFAAHALDDGEWFSGALLIVIGLFGTGGVSAFWAEVYGKGNTELRRHGNRVD